MDFVALALGLNVLLPVILIPTLVVFGLFYIYQTWLLRKSCNHLATIETILLAVVEKAESSQASDRSPSA
jgi:hypothetical protein